MNNNTIKWFFGWNVFLLLVVMSINDWNRKKYIDVKKKKKLYTYICIFPQQMSHSDHFDHKCNHDFSLSVWKTQYGHEANDFQVTHTKKMSLWLIIRSSHSCWTSITRRTKYNKNLCKLPIDFLQKYILTWVHRTAVSRPANNIMPKI